MGRDIIEVKGELNVRRAYELLGEIIGDRYGVDVKLKSLTKKNPEENEPEEPA